MIAVRLPPAVEKRLERLARKTGRSKTFYVREALLRHLEDLEDYYLTLQRLEHKLAGTPLEEVERRLGLSSGEPVRRGKTARLAKLAGKVPIKLTQRQLRTMREAR